MGGNDLCIVVWFSAVINDHLTTQPNRERQYGQWQDWMQAAKCFSFIPCNALHLHFQPSPHMQLGILHKLNGIGGTAQIMSLHTAQLHNCTYSAHAVTFKKSFSGTVSKKRMFSFRHCPN